MNEVKKLTIIKGKFKTEQLLRMLQKTPKNHIYTRPAKGGGRWEYVTGIYTKKVLNMVFGWMWSSTILDIREKHEQICVTVRVTIVTNKGVEIIHKDDIGKKDLSYRRGTKDLLDYGNDEKAAVTDGIKRCAAQLGIASDVYGKEEFKEIKAEEYIQKEIPISEDDGKPATEAQKTTIKAMKGEVTEGMTQAEAKAKIAELAK